MDQSAFYIFEWISSTSCTMIRYTLLHASLFLPFSPCSFSLVALVDRVPSFQSLFIRVLFVPLSFTELPNHIFSTLPDLITKNFVPSDSQPHCFHSRTSLCLLPSISNSLCGHFLFLFIIHAFWGSRVRGRATPSLPALKPFQLLHFRWSQRLCRRSSLLYLSSRLFLCLSTSHRSSSIVWSFIKANLTWKGSDLQVAFVFVLSVLKCSIILSYRIASTSLHIALSSSPAGTSMWETRGWDRKEQLDNEPHSSRQRSPFHVGSWSCQPNP